MTTYELRWWIFSALGWLGALVLVANWMWPGFHVPALTAVGAALATAGVIGQAALTIKLRRQRRRK